MSPRPIPSDTVCLATHLPPFQGGKELAWHESRRSARVRVVAWTCHEHRRTWYELCEAGGVSFIRRMTGDEMTPKVSETHAWRRVEAQAMWIALLSGTTR